MNASRELPRKMTLNNNNNQNLTSSKTIPNVAIEDVAIEGVLLVNKPRGKTSFSLVHSLRKILGVKKIGHAGTLDPFATGVMILLVGRTFTRLSDQFLCDDKEYIARVHCGVTTDSYDCDGEIIEENNTVPTQEEIFAALKHFQGEVDQVPPMFSAKKIKGQKLYDLARQGKSVERQPVRVRMETEFLNYSYPYLDIRVKCSKGTYIRSIAFDLGLKLGCGAHLIELTRTRSGSFLLADCLDGERLSGLNQWTKQDLVPYLIHPELNSSLHSKE